MTGCLRNTLMHTWLTPSERSLSPSSHPSYFLHLLVCHDCPAHHHAQKRKEKERKMALFPPSPPRISEPHLRKQGRAHIDVYAWVFVCKCMCVCVCVCVYLAGGTQSLQIWVFAGDRNCKRWWHSLTLSPRRLRLLWPPFFAHFFPPIPLQA